VSNDYVLITTKHRGVFCGYLSADESPNSVTLRECRMVIRFGTTDGLLQLTRTGPTALTKMSKTAPSARVFDITGVFATTDAAKSGLCNA